MQHRKLFPFVLVLLVLGGCSRDPEVAKKKFLESGEKYFKEGKYKEAAIMYQNALKKDARYGEAYWKLGETQLRRGEYIQASGSLRRAVELLPNNPEPAGRLADLYLAFYLAAKDKKPQYLDEIDELAKTLMSRDPSSYHGFRLKGYLEAARGNWKPAIEYMRKANAIKPNQNDLEFAMVQALTQDGQWPEAEKIANATIDRDKLYGPMYDFLFAENVKQKNYPAAEAVLRKKIANMPKEMLPRVQLSGFLYAMQRRADAQPILNGILSDSTTFPDGRIRVADFYMRAQEWDSAMKLLREGVEKDPARKSEYKVKMAMIDLAQGRYKEARVVVDEVLVEDPKNNKALELRAGLMLRTGSADAKEVNQAITDLQTLQNRDAKNPVIRYNLARAYLGKGDVQAARVQFQEAIKLRPDFIAARVGLAQSYMSGKDPDFGKVIQNADEILRYDPGNMMAQTLKSTALISSGNTAQARTEIEAALKKTPNSADLQYQLARVNLGERKYAEAEASFKKLHEQFPADNRPLMGLIATYQLTGRSDQAIQLLESELKKSPQRMDLQYTLANSLSMAGQVDRAIPIYQNLIDKNPNSTDLYMRLGELLRRKGQPDKSIELLQKGLQINPNDAAVKLQLAMTYEQLGRRKDAKPLYEAIIKVQPDNFIALNNLAFIMAEEGTDLDQALTYAQRAKQRVPKNEDIADTLGWIYIKKNLSDDAIRILQDLVAQKPNNALYRYHLAMAQFQKGDKVKARQSLQDALTKSPSKDDEAKIRELLSKVG